MKYFRFIIIVAAFLALLSTGCSDRGTNVPTSSGRSSWTVWPDFNHVFVPNPNDAIPDTTPSQLLMQIRNPAGLLEMAAYIPHPDYVPIDSQYLDKPLPLLILLAPQDGDKWFYFDHGLAEIAYDLISQGVIRPMIIVTVGNEKVFGGCYYGNSVPAGHMDDIMGSKLVDQLIDSARFVASWADVSGDPQLHGIGGIGMGAYGAFRAALKHPGVYKSISACDGPLDFDGPTGNSGLLSLVPRVFAEQGLRNDTTWDYIANNFDTLSSWPVSRMFVGGSLAFSPHDTQMVISVTISGGSVNRRDVRILSRQELADSATLISNLLLGQDIGGPIGSADVHYSFHLPFDSHGAMEPSTWSRWMANNLDTLLAQAGGSPLNGVAMWFGTSTQADYGFHTMTMSWINTLQNAGYDPTVFSYSGTDAHPATGSTYTYSLIREMLVFHSQAFGE